MVKVIIERQVKKGEDISSFLQELRTAAIHRPGYVTGETLVCTEDSSTIVVISTWRTLEEWTDWEASGVRTRLCQQVEALLAKKPRVRTYMLMSTE